MRSLCNFSKIAARFFESLAMTNGTFSTSLNDPTMSLRGAQRRSNLHFFKARIVCKFCNCIRVTLDVETVTSDDIDSCFHRNDNTRHSIRDTRYEMPITSVALVLWSHWIDNLNCAGRDLFVNFVCYGLGKWVKYSLFFHVFLMRRNPWQKYHEPCASDRSAQWI